MKKDRIEERFATAVEHATPDVLDRVLDSSAQPPDERVIPLPRHRRMPLALVSAAAALLLVAGALFGVGRYTAYNQVDTIIGLDVNPSIELRINGDERVLEVRALNADAEAILDGMSLRGTELDVAVNALIGSMLKNGCISELANSVLISVENDDDAKGAALRARLADDIGRILGSGAVDGAILSQTLTEDAELQSLAEQHGISVGKAALIRDILKSDPRLRFESLAGLTINELNLLAAARGAALESVTAEGSASSDAYIGAESAKAAALSHAGAPADEARGLEIEFDCDDGRMVYEVEFDWNGTEYDYDVDATTGAVVKFHHERTDGTESSGSETGVLYISRADARAYAMARAGVTEAEITDWQLRFDLEDDGAVYEVEFRANGVEYDIDIHAATGAVIGFDSERLDDRAPASSTGDTLLSAQQARDIALAHAGFTADGVRGLETELDEEDGRMVYEVEFRVERRTYQYDIDACSGEILHHEVDTDD